MKFCRGLFSGALTLFLLIGVASVFVEGASAASAGSVWADDGCVIPDSGPWPPCATGGTAPPASGGECVIPDSGPWPPCATDGGSAPAPPPSSGGECVIPDSGPWPPCATGGGTSPAAPPADSDSGDCIIPDSGPWPPCATGGGGSPAAPAPTAPPPPPSQPSEQSRFYSLGEIRNTIMNELILAAGDGPATPDDCAVRTDQQIFTLVCLLNEEFDFYIDMGMTFSVSDGQPVVTMQWIEVGGQRLDQEADAELFASIKAEIELALMQQFERDLNYTALISIVLDESGVTVTYR